MSSPWQNALLFALLIFSGLWSSSEAATVLVEESCNGANHAFAIYLAGQADDPDYDTFVVIIRPSWTKLFDNISVDGFADNAPLAAGANFTFINPYLAAPTNFGGEGFTISPATTTENEVIFAGGPFGETLDLDAPIFFANVVTPPGPKGQIDLISNGVVRQEINFDLTPLLTNPDHLDCPEPSTLLLASLAGVSILSGRRRYST